MNLIERVKNILLQPTLTWATIESEATDTATLFTRYAMVLALIPAVCGFIGMSLIGFGGFGVSMRVPWVSGLVNMVVSYAVSLVGIFVLGLIINALAPTFGGQKSQIQALKVAVYASTAALLGGVFNLLPSLSMLGVLAAFYSIYLMYTGLPVLMKNLPEKSMVYTAVVIVAAIVGGLVMGAVTSLLMPRGATMMGSVDEPAITLSTPNGKVSIDTAGLQAAGKKMEEAARSMEQAQKSNDPGAMAEAAGQAATAAAGMLGGGQAMAAQQLKLALPEKLADLPRTEFEVQDGAAMGLPTSQVSARYVDGDKSVRVEILDVAGLGQMAVMAMGMGIGEKETTTSAEKTWKEGGRTLQQQYAKDGSHSELKVVLKNGLIVSLEGDSVGIKDLQGFMSQIDLNGLERLQRLQSKGTS